jgi:hypothetical protein
MKHDTLHDQIAKRCIHFNGVLNDNCEAGICYKTIKDLPCFRKSVDMNAKPESCVNCEWPTEEYISEILEEADRESARMMMASDLIEKIKRDHKGKNWTGIEVCPVCGGDLHLSHAACNGHIWGKCTTPDCLSWIE